jgi:hypothetical protein
MYMVLAICFGDLGLGTVLVSWEGNFSNIVFFFFFFFFWVGIGGLSRFMGFSFFRFACVSCLLWLVILHC